MGRPKDDDLSIIDPYVQSLRKSHIQVLRKLVTHSLGSFQDPKFVESLTDDDLTAMVQVMKILGVSP